MGKEYFEEMLESLQKNIPIKIDKSEFKNL